MLLDVSAVKFVRAGEKLANFIVAKEDGLLVWALSDHLVFVPNRLLRKADGEQKLGESDWTYPIDFLKADK